MMICSRYNQVKFWGTAPVYKYTKMRIAAKKNGTYGVHVFWEPQLWSTSFETISVGYTRKSTEKKDATW